MTGFTRIYRRKHPPLADAILLYDRWLPGMLGRCGHVVKTADPPDAPATETPVTALANEDPHGKTTTTANTQTALSLPKASSHAEPGHHCRKPGGRAHFAGRRPGEFPGRAEPGPVIELEAG